ncbi:MAG: hypothetical protein R3A13_07440 [Bdellovibrionota bacterium]
MTIQFLATWGMWLHTFYFPNKKPTWGPSELKFWKNHFLGSSLSKFYDIFDQPGNERPKEILCANKADTTKYDFSELNGKKIVHNQILTNADFGPFTVKASIETGDAIDVVAFDYNNAPASYQYLGYLGTDVNQEPGLGSHKKQGIALTISDLVQDKNKDGISDTTPAPRSGYLSFYFKAISPVKVLSLVGVKPWIEFD